jgi:starch synthase
MRILFCAAEVAPFAKVGGLADVAGALPRALVALGHDVCVATPLHGSTDRSAHGLRETRTTISDPLGGPPAGIAVGRLPGSGPAVPVVHVDLPAFADRRVYLGDDDRDAERYAAFCRAVLALPAALEFEPDVVHANDWHTAPVVSELRAAGRREPRLAAAATVFTIHNLAYQGSIPAGLASQLGLRPLPGESGGRANLMARAIATADAVTTVSPTYAREISSPGGGEGLDALLARSGVRGIVNGIDAEVFDPSTDPALVERFDADHIGGRVRGKLALQAELGLDVDADAPLIGLVSRLVEQKGVDLLAGAAGDIVGRGAQLAILGSGDAAYEAALGAAAAAVPGRIGLRVGFDAALAQRIYAGADAFLMPSRFEPCGLGQLIAMRYGAVPIVRYTGGLADTVAEYDPGTGAGSGFLFGPYEVVHLLGAIDRALTAYDRRGAWRLLVAQVLRLDHSWAASARAYEALYAELAAERARRPVRADG